eukprot:CAMPEP_0175175280 /NCGR_PEP_ID=MMETSP0087-20121206/33110_1 /TAXON_ID=136419 /ORGANISM="Unknown Unknown, Strain D1" /LENGTH=394 /DNA_ID=CAMNT_0016466863 /DNA_START=53 /DNA_END=1237 /DNA_ORIENTATION=+
MPEPEDGNEGTGFDFRKREEELRQLDEQLNRQKAEAVSRANAMVREQEEKLKAQLPDEDQNTESQASSSVNSFNTHRHSSSRRSTRSARGSPSHSSRDPSHSSRVGGTPPSYGSRVGGRSTPTALPGDTSNKPATSHWGYGSDEEVNSPTQQQQQQHQEEEEEGGGRDLDGQPQDSELGLEPATEEKLASMSAQATIRYQKARLRVLEEAHTKLLEENRSKAKAENDSSRTLKALRSDKDQLTSKLTHASQEIERLKMQNERLAGKLKESDAELNNWKKDLFLAEKDRKAAESELQAKDIRFNRAIADAEKYRKLYVTLKEETKAAAGGTNKETDRLRSENRKLVQQKTELLAVFKKQFTLIDILKRQKMHVEAARLLSFTEEEFSKSLEIGDV